MDAQWCNLPKDILELISKNITAIEYYLRLRAVCVPWRSALSPSPRHVPPQPPWLMLPYDPNPHEGDDDKNSSRLFYDISNSKFHKINLPETRGKQYCGSSKGWLMLQNGPDFSLFNPITKVQIDLPSLKTTPNIVGVQNIHLSDDIISRLDVWPSRYGYKKGSDPVVQRTMLTSNPILDPNCTVMALFKNNWELTFCRIGDESWTIFEAPKEDGRGHGLIDAIYQNELFYCFSFDEVIIYNLDGSKREVMKLIIPLEQAHYHLQEGNLDELILIAQHRSPSGISRTDLFSIYKLGIEDDRPDWIELEGIGETMCFICYGIEQCFIFEGLRGNSLYYAYPKIVEKVKQDYFGWHEEDKFGYDIKMTKLPTNYRNWKENLEEIFTNFGSYPTNYSRALWIIPSLH